MVIVQETRGRPYQIFSLLLASVCLHDSMRCMFMCDYTYPWEPESVSTMLQDLWPECKTNKWQEFLAGAFGLLLLSMSVGSFYVATTSTVADFYFAIRFVLFMKIGLAFLVVRSGFLEWSPLYQVLLLTQIAWDVYLTVSARRAQVSRQKQRAGVRMSD
jgi:hypothetical protein